MICGGVFPGRRDGDGGGWTENGAADGGEGRHSTERSSPNREICLHTTRAARRGEQHLHTDDPTEATPNGRSYLLDRSEE